MDQSITIRPFAAADGGQVRDLFIAVNRLLAPAEMQADFEAYIVRSLLAEIDDVERYYASKQGGFWVAVEGNTVVGMFGLERVSETAMELRRMYVDPALRRRGIARAMLQFAEDQCSRRWFTRLELSTSELQGDALAFYRSAGYQLVREEIAKDASNKSLGGGIRRYHFTKQL